jgi:hypothetical protein
LVAINSNNAVQHAQLQGQAAAPAIAS